MWVSLGISIEDSGKNLIRLPPPLEGLKTALNAAVEVEVVAAIGDFGELEENSRRARRLQRYERKKLVKCSSGWRSQEVEGRWGHGCCGDGANAGGGCYMLGFITSSSTK
ncbi:hypothetical protein GOBAR_DD14735 [Gossypium barbadense]|nr:hypothetical protein GOBAR_DD14735 [Gossypium barbadense]